jgi:putative flippase GtrA
MSKASRFAQYLLRHSFIRFALVGAAGYVVDTGVLAWDTSVLGLDFKTGRALSIFVAMACTWLGNRYLTFRDRRARTLSGALQEWLKFMGANGVGAVVNYGTSVLLVAYAAQPLNHRFVAQACGVLAGLVFNFTLSKKLVFKGPI